MAEIRRLLQWGLVVTLLMLVTVALLVSLFYQAAFQAERRDLRDIASSQAHLIRAVVRFDIQHSPHFPGQDPLIAEGGAAATLSQIRDAFSRYSGLGDTGEFVLGHRGNDGVVIFLHQRDQQGQPLHRIAADDPRAEPMKRALDGQSGTVIAPDYKGQQVLAAYEPIRTPGWGLVAKRDVAEIRAPYVRAAILAGGAGLMLTILAGWGFSRVNDPLIRRLRQSQEALETERGMLRTVLDTLPLGVWAVDEQGRFFLHNPAGDALWARSNYRCGPESYGEFQGWDAETGEMLTAETWPVARTLRHGEQVHAEEADIVAFDGTRRTIRQWSTPLRGPDDRPWGALVVAEDISHLRSMQRLLQRNQRVLELVLDQLPVGVGLVDQAGHFVLTNAADRRIWGVDRTGSHYTEGPAAVWAEAPPAADTGHWPLRRALEQGVEVSETAASRGPATGASGEQFLQVSATPVGADDQRFGAVEMTQDVTAQRRAEAERRTLADAVRQTADAVFLLDAEGRITYTNPAFTEVTGYDADEARGHFLGSLVGEDGHQDGWHQLWASATARERAREVLISRRKNGERFYWGVTLAPLASELGETAGLVGTATDLTQEQDIREQLYHASRFDPLTDLPNRTHLMEQVQASLERGRWHHRVTALLLLDLEQFTLLNDTLGHAAGDHVLREVARRLSGSVRAGDTVARTGEDAFAVLLEDLARENDLPRVISTLWNRLQAPFWWDEQPLHLRFSMGVAEAPGDAGDGDGLNRAAETALLEARRDADAEIRYFNAEMASSARRQQTLEGGLRQALERDQLSLHFQPQIDLTTGRLRGLEALLRWTHPDWGAISPGEFIPVAERAGLIRPIGEWVLHQALHHARQWREAGLEPGILGVNLSALQVGDPELGDKLARALGETGTAPGRLELEITETALMGQLEAGADRLNPLREQGVGLSVDDFGTGYSSLAYLAGLPLDTLKIDRTFINDLDFSGQSDNAIVHSILGLAHSLGLGVVAEGVETEAQLAYLRNSGCEIIQGFLLGRPTPAETVPDLLTREDWLSGPAGD